MKGMSANALSEALMQTEERLEYSLGVAVVYDAAPAGKKYSLDYRARGAAAYASLRAALSHQLCDPRTKSLRPWVALVADGDARDLAVALLTIAAANLSISASVAVPLSALIAKRGLRDICSETPPATGAPPRKPEAVAAKPKAKRPAKKR